MSDKPKPVDDLKEGLGLLFRAAKGAVESLPTDKIEATAKDAAKEVGRVFESLNDEVEKLINPKARDNAQPHAPPPPAYSAPEAPPAPPAQDIKYDDGYAPEPPKGPRVG